MSTVDMRARLEELEHERDLLYTIEAGTREDGTKAAFARLSQELSEAIGELRELARGIHPAVLTTHGLEPALRALAERSPVPVEIELDAVRLPEAIEATAYFVVSEALANIAKYAEACSVSVKIAAVVDRLLVEVADDGVGGADAVSGSGLRGLSDRVEALSGRLTVVSPKRRGTTLRAEIPLAP
jgi:signal transduction histidine kinase